MEKEQLKQLTDSINESVVDLQTSIKEKASVGELEALQKDVLEKIEALSMIDEKPAKEYAKATQEQVNLLEEQIEKLAKGNHKPKSIYENLDDMLGDDDWKGFVKQIKGGGRGSFSKVLTTDNDLTAGTTTPVIVPDNVPGVTIMPRADMPIYALVQKGTTNSNKVSWIERTIASEDHNTAYVAENGLIPTSDALWTKVETAVTKIGDSFKVTNEMLEDTEFVRSEIIAMLTHNIPKFREAALLNGTGSSQINGINTMAKTFSLPSGADKVADPNNFDVLRAAILQVMLGYSGTDAYTKGFTPDAIILNPVDAHNLGNVKDSNGNYILPMWMSANGKVVDSIPVIQTTDQTAGTFTVGQVSAAKYYAKRGMEVKFWDQYDTDPLYDRVLFTGTERGAQKIGNIDAYAFVTGTFANGIIAITP